MLCYVGIRQTVELCGEKLLLCYNFLSDVAAMEMYSVFYSVSKHFFTLFCDKQAIENRIFLFVCVKHLIQHLSIKCDF